MSEDNPATSFVQIESIFPEPTEAEAAAIAQALEEVWPKPQRPAPVAEKWRFSGRRWSRLGNRFRA